MTGKKYESQIAIYKITNIINNKVYIGSTNSLTKRKSNHFSTLKYNRHKNKHLQNAYNMYGSDNFKFEIIEYLNTNKELYLKESYWINFYNSLNKDKGYNLTEIDVNSGGPKFSNETREFLRNKGKKEMTSEKKLKLTSKTKRKVKQFDMNMNFIKEHESLTQAAKEINGDRVKIYLVCVRKPRYKSHKKYIWRYSNEEQI